MKIKYPYETHLKLEFPIFGGASMFERPALKGYKIIIMVRDKVDFLWSFYNYFSLSTVPFKDFLDMPFMAYNMMGNTPLEQADFEKWIRPFMKYKPDIVHYEDIIKEPDFPYNQVTRTPNKPSMPQELRSIALERLHGNSGFDMDKCRNLVFT